MRDVLPFAAIALLLAANKNTPNKKPAIKVIYDCYRGCAMRNPFDSSECWIRDYDWTVTAYVPSLSYSLFQTQEQAQQYIDHLSNPANLNPDYGNRTELWSNEISIIEQRIGLPDSGQFRNLYKVETIRYTNERAARSASWDFNNSQEFFADQASKVISRAWEAHAPTYPVLPNLNDYSIDVSYTKEFDECAEKDMQLDMFVGFVEQYLVDYIVRQYIPVA